VGNFGRVAPGVDDLLASFADWAAAERVARAAAERSRARSLGEQAARSATWTGILVDLAERAAQVQVTAGGSKISGRLLCVGRDFLVVEQPSSRPCLVSVEAVDTLAPQPALPLAPETAGRPHRPALPGGVSRPALPGGVSRPALPGGVSRPAPPGGVSRPALPGGVSRPAPPGGSRRPAVDLSLLSALDSLAAERAPVALRSGTTTLTGDLLATGVDVLTIAAGPHGRLVHVPVAALAWCELR